jgi:hypothetical protein
MKITISKSDLITILNDHSGDLRITDVEISDELPCVYMDKLLTTCQLYAEGRMNKIEAIKQIRYLGREFYNSHPCDPSPVGLKQAKDFIELAYPTQFSLISKYGFKAVESTRKNSIVK